MSGFPHHAWTWQTVLNYEKKEAVAAAVKRLSGGAGPGKTGYIAAFQQGVNEVAQGLTQAEMAELRRKAVEWSNKAQPVELQRKYAAAGGPPAQKC